MKEHGRQGTGRASGTPAGSHPCLEAVISNHSNQDSGVSAAKITQL